MKLKQLSILFIIGTLFAQMRTLPADTAVVTYHRTNISGKRVEYSVTTGTQPLWSDTSNKPIAGLHYTYYERTDVANKSNRPIMISFNGGPGSGSVWMHMAYTGPMVLNVDKEGYPLQPYGVKPNRYSVLDVTDIVYVNPVNTGYSRAIDDKVKREKFFGIQADINYLAEWINTFIQRNNRWESPKYLIGESYGTIRVSGLALALQNKQWMYLNGVILVSPTELGIHSSRPQADGRKGPLGAALRLPYFTATAWYHKKLPDDLQKKYLPQVLALSEDYSINQLLPLMAKGNSATNEEKQEAAKTMARFSGISDKAILSYNLDVPTTFFWKELLRDEGYTIGRLDSRYKGIDKIAGGDRPDYWAELTSWNHSFAPAINYYFKNILKFETDVKYNLFGSVYPWDWKNNNSGESLRKAMAANPYLHTMIQSGYYDGATRYFDAKYTMWQLDPSGKMKDRLSFEGYRSGHMMYLREVDLIKSNSDIRKFIKKTTPSSNEPAKY
tara:strand:- start:777 stop:2273 length:1497 start_codon:yes stop_codon:yes gene_type:complete